MKNYKDIPTNKVFYGRFYHGFELAYGFDQFHEHALSKAIHGVLHQLKKYEKILFVRFNLHFPKGASIDYLYSNKLVSKFFDNLSQNLKADDPIYMWAREHNPEESELQHYHCFVIIKARTHNNPQYVLNLAQKKWELYFPEAESKAGLVHFHEETIKGIVIRRRNSEQAFRKAIQLISYNCKVDTKSYRPVPRLKNYSPIRFKE